MSPASASYRSSLPEPSLSDDEYPPADPSIPSDLPLPPSLKSAFQASLAENNVQLRFFSGSWEGFNPYLTGGPYNLVLTSETIYKSDGLSPLIKLMKAACGCHTQSEGELDELVLRKLSVQSDNHPYLCLVAAKVLYFGVGGSVSEFVHVVEGSRVGGMGKVETVWEKRVGIGRSIMRVHWA
jgi:protein-histidine N-methyltransferase